MENMFKQATISLTCIIFAVVISSFLIADVSGGKVKDGNPQQVATANGEEGSTPKPRTTLPPYLSGTVVVATVPPAGIPASDSTKSPTLYPSYVDELALSTVVTGQPSSTAATTIETDSTLRPSEEPSVEPTIEVSSTTNSPLMGPIAESPSTSSPIPTVGSTADAPSILPSQLFTSSSSAATESAYESRPEPTGSPTIPFKVESLDAETLVAVEAAENNDDTTSVPSNSISSQQGDINDIIAEQISLEFSLWFPDHRVSNLNIPEVEHGILNSLESLFCDHYYSGVVEGSDRFCLLVDEIARNDTFTTLATQARQHQVMSTPQTWQDVDATILLEPYVTNLDERYHVLDQDRVEFSWMNWQFSWEIFQIGTPILEKEIQKLQESTGSDSILPDVVYQAGVNRLQQLMTIALEDSIRQGVFDAILEVELNSTIVFSSSIGSELETFDFAEWKINKQTIIANDAETSTTVDSENVRDKAIIVAAVAGAFAFVVACGALLSVHPWKSRRQQESVHDILDDIVQEATTKDYHHLNSIKGLDLEKDGMTRDNMIKSTRGPSGGQNDSTEKSIASGGSLDCDISV